MIINMEIKGVPRRVHDIYLLYIFRSISQC